MYRQSWHTWPPRWQCVAPPKLAYSGQRIDRAGVEKFFADVPRADEVLAFEPREFIEAGENVIVLGFERAKAKDSGTVFESEWAHVFTVRQGKITRWRGFFDTAARLG